MNTWIEDIVNAMMEVGGVAHLSEIYEYIKRNTERTAKVAWQQNTRQRIYDNSTDASQYKGPEDIFFVVGELRSGIWGVRPEWLKAKGRAKRRTDRLEKESKKPLSKIEDMYTSNEDTFERIGKRTYQLSRNATRALRLKELYNYSCQVCGRAIRLDNRQYAETHHVKPRNGHKGEDYWDNMIVLCPNHHVEFDNGVVCIDSKTLRFKHKFEREIDGREIHLEGEHRLRKEYLEYAKTNFYD